MFPFSLIVALEKTPTRSYHLSMRWKIIISGLTILLLVFVGGIVLRANKTGFQNSVAGCDKYDAGDPVLSNARDICITNAARESQDNSLCNQIKDDSIKKLCEIQVYYWDKSVEFCEQDEQKNICLHTISIKNNDKSICSKIDKKEIRELCLNE